MLHHLEESDKKHYIFDPKEKDDGSGVGGTPQGGSKTIYNFTSKSEDDRFENTEGVPLRKVYDFALIINHSKLIERGLYL